MLAFIFKNRSIKDKLSMMHTMVVGLALLFIFLVIVTFQYIIYKHDLLDRLNAQVSVLEGNLGSAVLFEDKNSANEILAAFKLDDSVDAVLVELPDHSIFAQFTKRPLVQRHRTSRIARDYDIHIQQALEVNHQLIGTIHLYANYSQIKFQISIFVLTLLIAMMCASVLTHFTSQKIQKYIADPLKYLENLVTSISRHQDYSIRSTIESEDEIGALSNGINQMLGDIQARDNLLLEELNTRKLVEQKLEYLAHYDDLTKLPNRHAFSKDISELLTRYRNTKNVFYLLMLDLDNFKVVNDSHGHEFGDTLLLQSAERLREIFNDNNDRIYRIGGDEFAIIISSANTSSEVSAYCNEIVESISQKFSIHNLEFFVGVSIGVVQYGIDNYSESNLIKHADAAMYWAKSAGKNTFKFYSLELERSNYYTQKLMQDLQTAIQKNELELHYQPIINVNSAQMIGVEALLRWHHLDEGTIRPDIFIPIAESSGLIVPIGQWVIREAFKQLSQWQQMGHPDFFINVNISPRQLFDRRMIDIVHTAITDFDLAAKTIHLEITESGLMSNVSQATEVLTALRSIGVGVAIDDFGTGHSSMSYIKQFPISTIKIDKSFVSGVPQDEVDCAIIEALFALAKSLNLDVVAEGVETEEQYAFLRSQHCNKLQGYLFSKPLPAQNISDLLHQSKTIEQVARAPHQP